MNFPDATQGECRQKSNIAEMHPAPDLTAISSNTYFITHNSSKNGLALAEVLSWRDERSGPDISILGIRMSP